MDNFLDRYQLLKLNQNLRPIFPKGIQAIIESLPKKKSPGSQGQMVLAQNSSRPSKTPMLFKLFHKTETEGTLPSSFYEDSVTLKPKPQKDSTKNGITDQSH